MLKVAESVEGLGPATALHSPWRPGRRGWVVLGCAALLLVFVGGLYWQATRAAVRVDLLRAPIEAALSERLPAESRIAVGSTAISYRGGQGAILRMRDLELILPGVGTIFAAEVSSVTSMSALLSRRIDIRSVTVSGVDIEVSAVPPVVEADTSADLLRATAMQFMDRVVEADELMRGAGLREVAIRDADLHFGAESAAGRRTAQISEANWLPLAPGRSKTWVQLVEEGGAGWDFTLERRRNRSGSAVLVELEEVPVSALAPELADVDGGPSFEAKLTLQARVVAAPDGAFTGLRGMVSSGPGRLSLTGRDESNIATAALAFNLDATSDRLNIPNGEVKTLAGHVIFEGVADLSELDRVTLLGRVREGFLPTTLGDEESIRLVGGGMMARLNFADRSIEVERLQLITPQGSASAIGQASAEGATPGVSFALSFSEMPAEVIRALWPPFIAVKTRGWFDANVKSGILGPATLQVALPPDWIGPKALGRVLPSYALVGSMPFRAVEFSPLKTFPTIRQAQGEIVFANAAANIVAQSGVMTVPAKGELDASGTALRIPELGRRQQRGDLSLELSGSASALAELSDTAPLSISSKRGIEPDDLSGSAALSLDANIPLTEPNFSGVIPTFRLALSDFSSTSPIDGRLIEEADLVLEGNPLSYTVKGEGTLDGLQASVDMIMGTGAPEHSAVTASLDDAARERLGFGFGSLITGPVQASLSLSEEEGSPQPVALDLKDARISLPFLGWEKGPGVPATASFVMDKTETETLITDLIVSGKGFEARGALIIGADGRLSEMTLERLSLRPGDQLSVSAIASGSGYNVRVSGGAMDARGIVRGVRAGFGGGDAGIFPLRVSLDVESMAGENEVVLSDVRGSFVVTADGIDSVSLKGNANGNEPFDWTLGREGNSRVLRLFANGGGALIRFAGIYSRIRSGNLILDYSGAVGGVGAGVLVLRDFRVINEEALKPVLDSSSARAGMVHTQAQASGDLHFTQLRIPFTQKGWVINIDDAALRGSLVGATASGTINIPGAKMALSGTLIPAFGINNIAGAIPIIGTILGGGRNEGLVGITYKLFGSLDNPKLTMNPISAIAPGIFRKIFEYR